MYVDMYFESVQISYLCIYVSTAVPTAIGVVDIGPALRLPVRSDGPGPGVGLRALQSTEVRIRRRWTRLTFARHTGRRTPPLQTPRAAHELDPPVFLFPSPSVRSASTTTARRQCGPGRQYRARAQASGCTQRSRSGPFSPDGRRHASARARQVCPRWTVGTRMRPILVMD